MSFSTPAPAGSACNTVTVVHSAAATGYQRRSDTYAQARPSYHPDVVRTVVAACRATGQVIDLGAGTGISTSALVSAGANVIAVEPVAAMREALTIAVPDALVLDGTAEAIPQPDSSAAAVVVAQAFHWFNQREALHEIARVLEPQGALITMWNVRDESVPWVAAYTAIQDRVQGDTPRYRDMTWRRAIEEDSRFELAIEVERTNPQASGPEHTIGRFLSTSFIASLEAAEQDRLVAEIRALVEPMGPVYDYPYRSEAQIWRLVD